MKEIVEKRELISLKNATTFNIRGKLLHLY